MNKSRLVGVAIVTAALIPVVTTARSSAEPPPVDKVAPGYPVGNYTTSGDQASSCTAGFVVHNHKGTPILLMAGHCDEGGAESIYYRATNDWQPLGSFAVNMYKPPYKDTARDIGVVSLSETTVPVSTDLLGLTPVTGPARPAVGQHLCKVGSYSGMTCGKVTKVNSSKVFFEALSRHGDSGGPVYFENGDGTVTAVGLDSGTPDDEADCRIDVTGKRDCGGTTIAELIEPWMQKWELSFS